MPSPGDVHEHPLTGERVRFAELPQAPGEDLVLESTWTRGGHRAAAHVHPRMEERIEVLEGRLVYRVGDTEHPLAPGDLLVVPPGTPHEGWAADGERVRLRIVLRPGLRWAEVVERLFAEPSSAAVLLREFPDELAPP